MPYKNKADQAASSNRHYHRNRKECIARVAVNNKKYGKAMRALLRERKSVPCMDCNHSFPPCAMDFDHVRGEKNFNPSDAAARVLCSIKTLKEELEKCDVVCACCHRIRTHKRAGRES